MRMRSWAYLAGLCLGATLVGAPTDAQANGMLGHMYVSEQAVGELPEGELKTLLLENRDAYLNGSFLPDSGYAANDGYGEIAHWAEFVEAYIQWIRTRYSAPFDQGEAGRHVAVLLGAASHGMCDQAFDILLYDRSSQVDGDTNELDTGTDTWLVRERNLDGYFELPLVVDTAALVEVFGAVGHDVSPDTISGGLELAQSAHRLVRDILSTNCEGFSDQYPWASRGYLHPQVPGSYPWNATAIANHWIQIWRRINGDVSVDSSLVIGVDPVATQRKLALDRSSTDSWITLFTGHGMNRDTLSDSSVYVVDAQDNIVPTSIRLRGDRWAGTIQLKPMADWQPETTYRVILSTEAETLNGSQLPQDFVQEFTTDCDPSVTGCQQQANPVTLQEAVCGAGLAGSGGAGGVGGSGGSSGGAVPSAGTGGTPTAGGSSGAGQLAPAPSSSGDGGGCGCRVGRSAPSSWLALFGVGWLFRRRRR